MTNNDISKVYMGVSEVDKIYLGTDLIYPTTPPGPDYSLMPLTFEILSDGDIKWVSTTTAGTTAKTIEYNVNGSGWTSITSSTGESAPTISVHSGDTIQFRGNNNQYGYSNSTYNFFSGSAQFNAYGNIMSLIDSTGYTTMVGFPSSANQVFGHMFYKNDGIVSAENLILPATAFSGTNAYSWMFASATSLTIAPELPATELNTSCYGNMFKYCASLTEAPELPAKTLAQSCYTSMFAGCSNLNYIKCLATDISASGCLNLWVTNVASAGTFVKDVNMNDWTIGTSGIPVNWVIQDEGEPVVYSGIPLTFEIISGGTIGWTHDVVAGVQLLKTIEYRINDGEWTSITPGFYDPVYFSVNAGDQVEFRGNNDTYGQSNVSNYFITSGIKMNVKGNIMSLINATNYQNITAMTSANTYAFKKMFLNGGVVNAKHLVLPATALTTSCYVGMFSGCTSLITAPVLPATRMGEYCYAQMFENCTSLQKAPDLPSTSLANDCYFAMFRGCTNLITIPAILPAKLVANSCYYEMFMNCSKITTAPELPATTRVQTCYYGMFYGCTKLDYIKCMLSSPSNSYTYEWVKGVSATGTFVKKSTATWTAGDSGIPNGWTVVDAS